MADFKPDRELESKEFNETFKSSKPSRSPWDNYNGWPIWTKNLAKVLAGVAIIVILVLIGRSIHHHSEQHSKTTGSSTNTAAKKTATTPSASKTGNTGSPKSGNTSSGSTSPSSSVSGKSGTLANTGPGDVVAVFAVAAIAGTSAHYVVSRRQA